MQEVQLSAGMRSCLILNWQRVRRLVPAIRPACLSGKTEFDSGTNRPVKLEMMNCQQWAAPTPSGLPSAFKVRTGQIESSTGNEVVEQRDQQVYLFRVGGRHPRGWNQQASVGLELGPCRWPPASSPNQEKSRMGPGIIHEMGVDSNENSHRWSVDLSSLPRGGAGRTIL